MAGNWTAADVPDQSGRTVVVTGANSGIGFETTRVLARAGARVVLACRSVERGEAARADVEAEAPDASLDVRELDLADLESVTSFAEAVREEYDELHALVNNAGVMAIPRRETADGFEMQFGVNHLGHFALTGRLLPTLRETPGETRVVTVSSGAHRRGSIDFADLQHEDDYGKWDAYAASKLANLLFAYELQRRLEEAGSDVLSVACHPGYADTALQRRGPEAEGSTLKLWVMKLLNGVFAQSAERGALPTLYAATAADVEGGGFYGPDGLLGMRGYPEAASSSDASHDRETARRLWEVSEDLTGVTFDLPEAEAARPS